MTVQDARTALADAKARRVGVERRVDDLWHDAARRTFAMRILQPLEQETARLDAALRQLAEGLNRALAVLDRTER